MKRATFDVYLKKILLSFIRQNEKHNDVKIFSKKSENETENKNDTQEQLFFYEKMSKIHHTYNAAFIICIYLQFRLKTKMIPKMIPHVENYETDLTA